LHEANNYARIEQNLLDAEIAEFKAASKKASYNLVPFISSVFKLHPFPGVQFICVNMDKQKLYML